MTSELKRRFASLISELLMQTLVSSSLILYIFLLKLINNFHLKTKKHFILNLILVAGEVDAGFHRIIVVVIFLHHAVVHTHVQFAHFFIIIGRFVVIN
jgi:hypothetical protein